MAGAPRRQVALEQALRPGAVPGVATAPLARHRRECRYDDTAAIDEQRLLVLADGAYDCLKFWRGLPIGCVAVVRSWVQEGMTAPPEEIADFMEKAALSCAAAF